MNHGTRVVVVGSGFAGLAAVFSLLEQGCDVRLVMGRRGASALTSGAVDDLPWDEREHACRLLSEPLVAGPLFSGVTAFSEALGLWRLPAVGSPLPQWITTGGRLRSGRGGDAALLDLAPLSGRTILLPRLPRAEWDADSISRALLSVRPAQRVLVADAPVLRMADEDRISDGDLAARHDDPARLGWLTERLLPYVKKLGSEHVAVLLGPWLGAQHSRSGELSERLGCPVGEVLHPLAMAPGLRFEAARSAWLSRTAVTLIDDRVASIRPGATPSLTLLSGETISTDACVLAVGGVLGGGVVYEPAEFGAAFDGPTAARPPFRLSLELNEAQVFYGHRSGVSGGVHGVAMDEVAWPNAGVSGLLESVGLRPGASGSVADGVFVCGDLIEGRSRTVLEAVASGLRAGEAAARSLPAARAQRRTSA